MCEIRLCDLYLEQLEMCAMQKKRYENYNTTTITSKCDTILKKRQKDIDIITLAETNILVAHLLAGNKHRDLTKVHTEHSDQC